MMNQLPGTSTHERRAIEARPNAAEIMSDNVSGKLGCINVTHEPVGAHNIGDFDIIMKGSKKTFIYGTEKKPHSLRYNDGKVDWGIVDFKCFEPMVRVLMYGAHKYSTFRNKETGEIKAGQFVDPKDLAGWETITSGVDNWKLGFNVRALESSRMRHVVAMQAGEVNDPESGLPHIGHIMCNDMFIAYYTTHPEGIKKAL